jgi:hypothetical protein
MVKSAGAVTEAGLCSRHSFALLRRDGRQIVGGADLNGRLNTTIEPATRHGANLSQTMHALQPGTFQALARRFSH